MTTPTTQREADERAKFEAWAKRQGHDVVSHLETGGKVYVSSFTRHAWTIWQARAAIDQTASPAPAEYTRAGWFLYKGIEWVATSSDDPRATILYRKAEALARQAAPEAPASEKFDMVDYSKGVIYTNNTTYVALKPSATPAATTASASTIKTWQERCGDTGPTPSLDQAARAMKAEIADLRAALARATRPAQDDEPPSAKQEKLRALADRIDHEKLWKLPLMYRDSLTDAGRDRLDAGIALRRYAELLAPGRWIVFPPTGPVRFSASTLDKAYEMAKRDQDRAAMSRANEKDNT